MCYILICGGPVVVLPFNVLCSPLSCLLTVHGVRIRLTTENE